MATAGVGPRRGRGGGREGDSLTPLSESSWGNAKPLRSLQPSLSQQVTLPPRPLPAPRGGSQTPPYSLRRPRARAATRLWNRGDHCKGEGSARRLPLAPMPS